MADVMSPAQVTCWMALGGTADSDTQRPVQSMSSRRSRTVREGLRDSDIPAKCVTRIPMKGSSAARPSAAHMRRPAALPPHCRTVLPGIAAAPHQRPLSASAFFSCHQARLKLRLHPPHPTPPHPTHPTHPTHSALPALLRQGAFLTPRRPREVRAAAFRAAAAAAPSNRSGLPGSPRGPNDPDALEAPCLPGYAGLYQVPSSPPARTARVRAAVRAAPPGI